MGRRIARESGVAGFFCENLEVTKKSTIFAGKNLHCGNSFEPVVRSKVCKIDQVK